jgi:membrane protein DedA with SNARE-associated domain
MAIEFISLEALQELAHQYGYWTVFFGIMLENAGIPIPGETITVVGGFLAGSGELNFWWVLASATLGAALGDNVGYWIGAVGGWNLLVRLGRLFRISEGQLIQVKKQFSDNAAKAVFLGRFVALLRIFAGPLAGLAQMPYGRFLIFNFAGAATWASVMVSLSYFLGRVVPLPTVITWISQIGLVALVAVAVWIGVLIWLETRRNRLGHQKD